MAIDLLDRLSVLGVHILPKSGVGKRLLKCISLSS